MYMASSIYSDSIWYDWNCIPVNRLTLNCFHVAVPSTSSQSVPHPSPRSQPPLNHTPTFPEEDIQQITSMGFPRGEAVQELMRTNGNVQLALTALLARSIKL